MDDPQATPAPTSMIDVSVIRPNDYNPNWMTERQFQECVAEVKHLGQLPHPLIVRPIADDADGKQFEIVDGEHRYRVALEIGMTQVPCEVKEIDKFESMRQTHKRNRGGRDNKVRLGEMFLKMQAERNLSRRKLSNEINVPQTTIRQAQEYARAAQLRATCAPATAEADIARLTYPQVQYYLELRTLRDKWLDAGADSTVFENRIGMTDEALAGCLVDFGLAEYLGEGTIEFPASIRRLAPLVTWIEKNQGIDGVAGYAQAIAEFGLSAEVTQAIPLRRQNDQLQFAISVPVWREALRHLRQTSENRQQEVIGAQAAVRTALVKAGVDLASVLGPAEAEAFTIVSQAPGFIRTANTYLTLNQQRWLTEVDADVPVEQQELVLQAKEQTCTELARGGSCSDRGLGEAYYRQRQVVFNQLHPETGADDDAFATAVDDALVTAVADRLVEQANLTTAMVGGQPAASVLRERIDGIEWPEFRFLAALVLGRPSLEEVGRHWLDLFVDTSNGSRT